MSRCPTGTCKAEVNAMIARRMAAEAVEQAIKTALAYVRRSISSNDVIEAVNEGLLAAKPFLDAISKD